VQLHAIDRSDNKKIEMLPPSHSIDNGERNTSFLVGIKSFDTEYDRLTSMRGAD
jgi:hypothetical protein